MVNNIKIEKCNNCTWELPFKEWNEHNGICPNCGHYRSVSAYSRINSLADGGIFKEWKTRKEPIKDIAGDGYIQKLASVKEKSYLNEAIVIGEISIARNPVAIGVMDVGFMMGSMGREVGECVTTLFEKAVKKKLPVLLICCSGGARIQEGLVSLMQMEKTAAAAKKHNDAGLLYISVLTNPTMGGVTASFAMLADVILAEKGAKIGFAGERVIAQNMREKLSENFQTAEFQREHGFVDQVVSREKLLERITIILKLHKRKRKKLFNQRKQIDCIYDFNVQKKMRALERIKLVRAIERPTSKDYIEHLFEDFFEICGDRLSGDDPAIIAGICHFNGKPVTVIGHQKGKKSLEEAVYYNWGMATPQGYRKARRAMKQAEKFNRPIICFIDTIGADCRRKADEHGQSIAIAKILQDMSALTVPILSIVISEGASGGALALGVGNEVWMLENAIYSIVTPEVYASIRWKNNNKVQEAVDEMKLLSKELLEEGIIDKVIPEMGQLTRNNMDDVCNCLEGEINNFLSKYCNYSKKKIVEQRNKRFRKY